MERDDDFRVRPGRIRSRQSQRTRPFINQALAAAQKAGGTISRTGRLSPRGGSRLGRGQVAATIAQRGVGNSSRRVVVKGRVVAKAKAKSLGAHLDYLRRDGVTRDGGKGMLFGAEGDDLDHKQFAERCADDRHHFRFIVSPEDAAELDDLKGFTRELMEQAQKDLGTRLDWVAVEHWNTGQPHVHVIVRGVREDGQDLVIDRDYISNGLRDRARELVTHELGIRSQWEIDRAMGREVDADRWTDLDRQLKRIAAREGVIDMAPAANTHPGVDHVYRMARLRKLEGLGLAEEIGPGQWTLSEGAEPLLRALGERDDIIKRMHKALTAQGIDRGAQTYVLDPASDTPVVGRLVARGLDDELKGTAYAVIDGVDGRTHHVRLPDLDAAGDSPPGSIVELRHYTDRKGEARMALAVRSDLPVHEQITAPGATWLDRRLLSGDRSDLGGGFGANVTVAMEARAEHLAGEGLARRQGSRWIFARRLLDTLRRRELDVAADRIASETGLAHRPTGKDETVSGVVRQRLALASGRYAMIDDGLGFSLVPWTPTLDRHLGQHVNGVMRGDGGVDWSMGRNRGLGI